MGEKQTTGVRRARLGHTWGSQGTLPASLGPVGGLEGGQQGVKSPPSWPGEQLVQFPPGGECRGRGWGTVSGSAESPRKMPGLDSDGEHPSHQKIQFH